LISFIRINSCKLVIARDIEKPPTIVLNIIKGKTKELKGI